MSPGTAIAIRVGAAAAVFTAMALWEWLAPRRQLAVGRRPRWPGNLGSGRSMPLRCGCSGRSPWSAPRSLRRREAGDCFHRSACRLGRRSSVGVVALDLTIYMQHVVFHHVPWLWRLHRMHHADLDIDVTTGVRFHPVEIVLSILIKIVAAVALGVPALGVVIFEVLLNATSLFNHSNVALPPRLDASRAGSSSRRRCTRCITRSSARKPTAISASICHGGTVCSAPIAESRRPASKR